MPKIQRIEATKPLLPERKKVAAYARVSVDTKQLMHSLSAQISYYSDLIQRTPEWEYAGVYADAGITGTDAKVRPKFQQMIADCEAGKIDIILTKSISRFARNTVDLLATVRYLKGLGVEVRFEKERINTFTSDGEVMLSILASFAEQESTSLSQNIKWTVRKRYEQGQVLGHMKLFGYRWEGDERVIVPEEAEVVRFIFAEYLSGRSFREIARELDEKGVKSTTRTEKFSDQSIRRIISNEAYTGNLILQQNYAPKPRKCKKNNGELPQYRVEGHHEAIIDQETFDAVQRMRQERGKLNLHERRDPAPYSGLVWCGKCGSKEAMQSTACRGIRYRYWGCDGKVRKKTCDARSWRDPDVLAAVQATIGTEDLERRVKREIKRINLFEDYAEIILTNGRKTIWQKR